MNGTKPSFIREKNLTDKYYTEPNPYEIASTCNVNLLELSRYAKKQGKKLVNLIEEDVNLFLIHD